jgi:hypothetical protein
LQGGKTQAVARSLGRILYTFMAVKRKNPLDHCTNRTGINQELEWSADPRFRPETRLDSGGWREKN